MQKRILAFFGLLGAIVGIIALAILLMREPRRVPMTKTRQPPKQIAPPKVDDLTAVREKGTVKGRVLNGVDRKTPIPGATVIALKPYLEKGTDDDIPTWGDLRELRGGSRVVTGPDGRFSVKDLPPHYWNLWVEKKGYAWTTLPRAKFNEEHVIYLFPGCSVKGKVVFQDGEPAPGIRIEYTPQGTHSEVFSRFRLQSYWVKTDAGGEFEYRDLPATKFTIEVYPEDHLPAPWKYQSPLKPGENRDLGVRKLSRGFGMKVYVKWRRTKRPVEGIEVVVSPVGDPMPRTKTGRRRLTNEAGLAVFSGLGGQVLPNPRFQVTAHVNGVGIVVPDGQSLVKANETVTIYLREDSTVKGKVLRPDGEPLDQFFVELKPVGFLTRQLRAFGKNGEFTAYSVPEGDYEVTVRYPIYVEQTRKVTAVAGEEADLGTITMQEGAEVSGVVRNSKNQVPDGRIRVHLAKKVFNARLQRDDWVTVKRGHCDKDGAYVLKGVPPGTYWLWPENMTKISRTTPETEIVVTAGTGLIARDLTMWGEGKLKLRFLDEVDGSVREVVRPKFTWVIEKRTGKEIRWFGEGQAMRPGTYTVVFQLRDRNGDPKRYSWRDVEIQAGETTGPIEVKLHEIR